MPGVATYDTADPNASVDASAISDYQKQLGTDEGALGELAKQQQASQPQFTEKPPERQIGITSVAPFLIGLAALGGKVAGLHATTMLGATNGMVQGLIQGNEEKYRDQKAQFDATYQQYRDKWDQHNKIFNEMREVYKGRVDADQKALQFARQLQHDDRTATLNDAKLHLQAQKIHEDFVELVEHHGWQEAHGDALLSLDERKLEMQKQKAIEEAGSPENADLAAALTVKDVNIKGYRGKQLQMVLSGLRARYPDKTNDEIAAEVKSGHIDMRVASTEASKLATREASIAPLEHTIVGPGGFLEQAEQAVDEVDFPSFLKEAQAKHFKMQQLGDPKLTNYTTAVSELRADYSQVLQKGGQPTEGANARALEVVPDIITKAQFARVKQRIIAGIEASKKGVRESIEDIGGTSAPEAPPQPPPKYAYDASGKKTHQLINGNWVPIAQ
jgi:hypothetical protein